MLPALRRRDELRVAGTEKANRIQAPGCPNLFATALA
jgi:hypothetical protein